MRGSALPHGGSARPHCQLPSGIIIIKIIIILVIIITFNFVIINVTNGGLINCWIALVGLAWEGESAHRLSHLVSAIATLTMRLIAPVIYFALIGGALALDRDDPRVDSKCILRYLTERNRIGNLSRAPIAS